MVPKYKKLTLVVYILQKLSTHDVQIISRHNKKLTNSLKLTLGQKIN